MFLIQFDYKGFYKSLFLISITLFACGSLAFEVHGADTIISLPQDITNQFSVIDSDIQSKNWNWQNKVKAIELSDDFVLKNQLVQYNSGTNVEVDYKIIGPSKFTSSIYFEIPNHNYYTDLKFVLRNSLIEEYTSISDKNKSDNERKIYCSKTLSDRRASSMSVQSDSVIINDIGFCNDMNTSGAGKNRPFVYSIVLECSCLM